MLDAAPKTSCKCVGYKEIFLKVGFLFHEMHGAVRLTVVGVFADASVWNDANPVVFTVEPVTLPFGPSVLQGRGWAPPFYSSP